MIKLVAHYIYIDDDESQELRIVVPSQGDGEAAAAMIPSTILPFQEMTIIYNECISTI